MKRLLALLLLLALAVPRIVAPASANASSYAYPSHEIFVDPNVYHSVGNVYILEFDSIASKNLFVKSSLHAPGVKLLHAYKYLPFVILGGDVNAVIDFAKHIPGAKALYANEKFYLQRNLDESVKPENLGDVVKLGAQTFREHGYTGKGIVIAIIDTGIYKQHQEFNYDNGTCKVIYEESFVLTIYGYDHDETNPDDGVGHGTMVAGAAAGLGKQPDGQGVAPDAALVNLKVFPSGQDTYATTAGIIAAIDKAIELKTSGEVDIDIINMSLGGSPNVHYDPELVAVRVATEHGIAVVIAAGNEGQNGLASGYVSAPGVAPLAITAGAAYDRNDTIEGYSSPGPTPRLGVKPDVVAPGTGSYPVPPFVSDYGYRAAAGTSFASPHVAGSVALILNYLYAHGLSSSPETVGYAKATLMHTAVHIVKKATTNVTFGELRIGAGFVNLTNAYRFLEDHNVPKMIYVLPTKLPVAMAYNGSYPILGPLFPRSNGVYYGQHVKVNFTVTGGESMNIRVELAGDILNAITVISEQSFTLHPPTTTYLFEFSVNEVDVGVYTGQINFVAENGTILFTVPVELPVLGAPQGKILRDLVHTDRGYDTPYGQFSLFAKHLEDLGYAIDIIASPSEFTLENIDGYDLIFTCDFASPIPLSMNDAKTFIEYIEQGGAVISLVMDTQYYDIYSIGYLAYAFGIDFGTQSIQGSGGSTVNAKLNSSLPFDLSGNIPMYGIPVIPKNPGVLTLASYLGTPVAAMAVTPSLGALIVFGTNFLFDNRAMTDQYGISADSIIENVLHLINYKSYLTSLGLVGAQISYTPSEPSIGDTVNVATNIPVGNVLKLAHSDRVESEEISGSFTITRAGPNAIGLSMQLASYKFGLVEPLRVEPSELNPPTFQQGPANIVIGENETLNLTVYINDETGIEASKISVAVLVEKVTGNMSIAPSDVVVTKTDHGVRVDVVFTPDKFFLIFGSGKEATLYLFVLAFDLNYQKSIKSYKYEAIRNVAPTLDVSYSTEPGKIKLDVKIDDDDAENRLIVRIDGEVVYNETVSTGESISLSFSVDAGSHNVTVCAIDPAGSRATRSEVIEVPQQAEVKEAGMPIMTIALTVIVILAIVAVLYYLFVMKKKA